MTQISERLLVQAHLDAKQPKPLTPAEEAHYRAAIAAARTDRRNAGYGRGHLGRRSQAFGVLLHHGF